MNFICHHTQSASTTDELHLSPHPVSINYWWTSSVRTPSQHQLLMNFICHHTQSASTTDELHLSPHPVLLMNLTCHHTQSASTTDEPHLSAQVNMKCWWTLSVSINYQWTNLSAHQVNISCWWTSSVSSPSQNLLLMKSHQLAHKKLNINCQWTSSVSTSSLHQLLMSFIWQHTKSTSSADELYLSAHSKH